jgi:polyphosphate kinase
VRDRLLAGLGATEDQLYPDSDLLGLADLMELARIVRSDLMDEPWLAATQPRIVELDGAADFFDEIKRGDILVHHPYESFATSFEAFVRGAAKDAQVLGLKTTVYRTSDETPLVPALVDAAEEGKQSVCLVELKAASTNTGTSSGPGRWSVPASTSSTASPTSRSMPRRR